jgi:L-iditol 2-dehydrogenase
VGPAPSAIRTNATRQSGGFEAGALVECSGSPDASHQRIRALRPGGERSRLACSPTTTRRSRWSYLQSRKITLAGSLRYADIYPAAIALAASGRIDLESLIASRFDLDSTEAALRAGREEPAAIKAMLFVAR